VSRASGRPGRSRQIAETRSSGTVEITHKTLARVITLAQTDLKPRRWAGQQDMIVGQQAG